ncbi:MAG: response regulator transcription factor [Gaiellaceae bacterium]
MPQILVIDDEPKIVSFVSRALTGDGFAVDSAADGVHGLALAARERYDLVVLDLLMPGLDGVGVLHKLMSRRPRQQVIVLSAVSEIEAKVRCLDLGAADYLTKPFALAELLARVRSRLRGDATPPEQEHLRAGRLTLDLRRQGVEDAGRPVSLTNREFLLLEHLVRNVGAACTREELLTAVWGYDFDPGTNVVDVYVRRLRSKLGAGVVETVRNVGYAVPAA